MHFWLVPQQLLAYGQKNAPSCQSYIGSWNNGDGANLNDIPKWWEWEKHLKTWIYSLWFNKSQRLHSNLYSSLWIQPIFERDIRIMAVVKVWNIYNFALPSFHLPHTWSCPSTKHDRATPAKNNWTLIYHLEMYKDVHWYNYFKIRISYDMKTVDLYKILQP